MRMIEYEKVKFRFRGMLFTWDDRKAAANFRKHGVKFSEAAAIFLDDRALIEINSTDEYTTGEERLQAVGMVYGDIMYMVYVERITVDNKDIIRIISAREATKEEERIYAYGIA